MTTKLDFRYAGLSQYLKNQCNPLHQLKKKNNRIIGLCAEKTFEKIQHPFIIKTLSKLETEVKFLNLIKTTYKVLRASIILNSKKLEAFPV